MGKAEGVKNGITRKDRRTQPIFYVYVYWIDDTPFYVGKGWGQRCREHFRPKEWGSGSTLMQRKMAKLIREGRRDDIRVEFFIRDVDEETAFLWEGFLVRFLGRRCDRDGPLCNLTWGGDITNTGYTHSQVRRDKIKQASRTRWRDPEKRKQILVGMRNRPKTTISLERREQIRQAQCTVRGAIRTERIRRLQAGNITWVAVQKCWDVRISTQRVGQFDLFIEAERNRVEACKAIRDGRFDEWVVEFRGTRKQKRIAASIEVHKQARMALEARATAREMTRALVREARAYSKFVVRHADQIAKLIDRDASLAEKLERQCQKFQDNPWSVKSPQCVFALLVFGKVQYVGSGAPRGIYPAVHYSSTRQTSHNDWLSTLDEKPEVCVVFMETREQAKAWKSAWIRKFEPPIGRRDGKAPVDEAAREMARVVHKITTTRKCEAAKVIRREATLVARASRWAGFTDRQRSSIAKCHR